MQAAKKLIEEIKRQIDACSRTQSDYLKRDYNKSIKRMKKDLREYCFYRGFNYKKIIGELEVMQNE